MLTFHPTIVEEAGCSGVTPETCGSWQRNHPKIERVLCDLYRYPFRVRGLALRPCHSLRLANGSLMKPSPEPWEEDLENAVKFDQWAWANRLLRTINASFPNEFAEQQALVRKIRSLEIEFGASDRVSNPVRVFRCQFQSFISSTEYSHEYNKCDYQRPLSRMAGGSFTRHGSRQQISAHGVSMLMYSSL